EPRGRRGRRHRRGDPRFDARQGQAGPPVVERDDARSADRGPHEGARRQRRRRDPRRGPRDGRVSEGNEGNKAFVPSVPFVYAFRRGVQQNAKPARAVGEGVADPVVTLLTVLILVALLILALAGVRIVQPYEQALWIVLGKYRGKLNPGFNWVYPLVSNVV